ncbi:hypothetical protein [Thauera propionica]|uniref:hypothetical protein n=1 Tax=Thauera propionica TaxID=2019431 RepID=UPI0023F07E41|nr:hypothetical protein [Thauera propionica]MDD3676942.1 hypothetical protein [Thauera propionica]
MSRFMQREERVKTAEGEFVVRSIDPHNKLVELFDLSSGELKKVTLPAMRRQISDGSMRRLTVKPMSGTVRDLAQSDSARRQLLFNQLRLRRIESHLHRGDSKAEAIRKLIAEPLTLDDGTPVPPISERQAYRLIDAASTSPLDLMPAHAERGNRRPRHPKEVEELLRHLIEEEYAKVHSRITMRKLAELATTLARAKGLIAERNSISRAYVRDFFTKRYHGDIDYRRIDPRIARSKKAVAKERIRVDAALQRVEQDTNSLPFIVMTSEGPLKNPYLTVSIDCGTGVPLGWHLSKTPVTEEETLDCLERSLYSKSERFSQLSIDCSIDPYGLFANLYLDNGPENKGRRITRITEIGIFLTRVAANSGHHKPFIERFFGSLKPALEGLPGCTRFNGKDGARTEEAMKDDLLTLDELERWIVRWMYEEWIHKPLERFITADYYDTDEAPGIRPSERWKYYEQNTILPNPPDRERWIRMRYLTEKRSLSPKTGLPIEGFRYRGEHLRELIRQYGPDAQVTAYYSPSDYRFAYVADRETGELLRLVNAEVTATTPAFSFTEAKKRRAHIRKSSPAAPACVENFRRDLAAASLTSGRRKRGHMAEQRDIREAAKLSKAIQKGHADPIPAQTGGEGSKLWTDEVFLTDDAIPDFELETKPRKSNGGAVS